MNGGEIPEGAGRTAPGFLAGGGEMGALIRGHDWTGTPLGDPATWPQSLRTALRIMLTSRQPIWIGWGKELVYFYNDPYKAIIGGKHPWALGKPTSVVWREIWPDIGPMLATATGGVEGTYVEEQLLIMERNGYPEETYYTFSYSPIPDDDGTPGGIICANTDDTQRVIGERQLALLRDLAAKTADARTRRDACDRSAEALAAATHDVTFALIYLVDPDGGAATLAASAGLPPGHAAAPAFLPMDGAGVWPIAALQKDHAPILVENLQDRFGDGLPGGAWRQPATRAAVLAIPGSGETGRAGALVVGLNPFRLFNDAYRDFLGLVAGQISAALANAEAYEEERRRAEALAELDHAKTVFFSNVSHEFRTPLTLMLGPLEEILSGRTPPDEARGQVALAHRNGTRLLRLVNSLLDFSRIEAGRVQASYQPTDLAPFCADLASSFRSAIERAGLGLSVSSVPLPEPVYIDREMWEKILLNLLSNAFKFTFDGEISVAVEPSPDGRSALVKVRDTGIGIPATELPRLFERFHRIEGAQGRSFEGSGIGLALVHELVKLHGGTITVESAPGAGTTFTVALPLGASHLPADRVRDGVPPTGAVPVRAHEYVEEALRWLPGEGFEAEIQAPGLGDAVSGRVCATAEGRRVLLADDNADMRAYLARLLETQGHAVTAVADGQAALAAAREAVHDLVLTDVMMPGLDGFGLLRALRAEPATAGVPVVMLSARAGEEARIGGVAAGADDYLTKPFTARELLARVNANIQLAELRRESVRALRESEARFRNMADHAPVMMWVTDVDGRGTYLNRGWYEFTGQTEEEALGFGWLDAVHPDDRTWSGDAFLDANSRREAFRLEYRLRRADGEYRWALDAAAPRFAEDGTFLGYIGSVIDITERKEAENAVRESRAYLRELLNSADEGFYAVDRDGRTTLVNRAFLRMLGFEREEDVIGRRIHDVIHHSHADGTPYHEKDCPIYRTAGTGEPAHVESELFFRSDGSSLPVEYGVHPVRRDGKLIGAICTFVDISERLAVEAAIRENQTALEEQTRALQILNRASAAMSAELDIDTLVQAVTDAGVEVSGAEFGAFFYNVIGQAGESYMLYTLSGAPMEAFSGYPMPRNTAVFEPTFRGVGVVRSDDITRDPRYGRSGPHYGMPEGHLPVRSYLAVPVRSRTGEMIGGLFFGHAEPGVFGDLAEERVVGLAGQAAIAMDNARLFQAVQDELAQRCRAEEELQALNSGLEERVATEVAERTKAEDALRQAQKMEAVGQLTGGIAHDFNNLLTVIIGGLDTIRRSRPGDEIRVKRAVDMALQATERAANLTGRLLAFSRRQPLEPKPVELNALVRDMTELLHRTLGEHIELEGVLAPRLWTIEADQNQLESAILNLAVNARDAMPDGGKLTIETANTALDEAYAAMDSEVIPGQYVAIAVSDTGSGIPKDVLERVFEPFFTTKEVGRGTGLGLSMVYGFVKQSGGHVTLYSEEGQGTTVKLYFPRHFGGTSASRAPERSGAPMGSEGEVVLVVEDNEDVRTYSVAILAELGYRVLEAAEADAALAILGSDRRIDLLFTDVVLPGKSGRVLADAAASLRPDLKILFTTGYSRNAIVHHGRLDPGVQLITKPFTFEQLATRVRDLLDRP